MADAPNQRRAFLGLLAGALATPALAQITGLPGMPVAPAAAPKPSLPFTAVGPFKEDEHKVFAFFLFSCPFCRQHMPTFEAWGATLPAPLRFEAVPIPYEQADLQGARAFFAVRRAAPEKLAAFTQAAYVLVQDSGAAAGTQEPYLAAAKEAGIDRARLDRWWNDKVIAQEIVQARRRTDRYRVAVTPTLAIGGQFVTEAGRTNGDYTTLITLANGIISQMLPLFSGKAPT